MIYNIGAIFGAIIFGHFSQTLGRRKSMIAALGLSLVGDSAVGFRRKPGDSHCWAHS